MVGIHGISSHKTSVAYKQSFITMALRGNSQVAYPMTAKGDAMCDHKASHTVLITVVLLLGVVASVGAQRSKSVKQEPREVAVEPATSTPPTAERRIALVIGNAAYAEGPLTNPVNDATDMASALQKMDF